MPGASQPKKRVPRNRTLTLSDEERRRLRPHLITTPPTAQSEAPYTGIVWGDYRDWVGVLPLAHVDLLFLDPPYNLNKRFHSTTFTCRTREDYTAWLNDILGMLKPLLKPTATIYLCGDWRTSLSIFEAASNHFSVRNRITWEREKGRGAKANWKNACEDIWFCTMSNSYTFNVDAVKMRRKVIAPYTDDEGMPKDWIRSPDGVAYRDTHPSNMWTDITIPFWSMPENTEHPTQKSEKLLAKLLLASTNQDDFVLDPFLGSGTSAVVASKLGRRFLGIECEEEYCLLASRRLELAHITPTIQGFEHGVFWERNAR